MSIDDVLWSRFTSSTSIFRSFPGSTPYISEKEVRSSIERKLDDFGVQAAISFRTSILWSSINCKRCGQDGYLFLGSV